MSDSLEINFNKYFQSLRQAKLSKDIGKVTQVTGYLIKGYVPGASVGSICEIFPLNENTSFLAEVIGFQKRDVLLMPLGNMTGVGLGSKIVLMKTQATIGVGPRLLGRVIDAMGNPLDGKGHIDSVEDKTLYGDTYNPMMRPPIHQPLELGVKAIDGLMSVGKGQRVGVMAGSGVGKSVLMGMIAKSTNADVNIIALIGERGREVREFIEDILGEEGLKKSVVIVATSDQSPLVRMRGAFVAASIAEYFSSLGKDVVFMMDSVTRFAMAQREIGLNSGEPPASKGYTPSVFSLLPKLLERAGTFDDRGSITGLYTVLVEGDDMDDPIGDSVRSLVDGHIILDRTLAEKGHFPAIDILQSTSRVMRNIVNPQHLKMAQKIKEHLAVYGEAEDLINIGAYKQGSNLRIDRAIEVYPQINDFLRQDISQRCQYQQAIDEMAVIVGHELEVESEV